MLNQSSGAEIQVAALERDADAARSLLRAVLERSQQTVSQTAIEKPDARVLSPATVPGRPSFPKIPLFVAAATILGILFGLLVRFYLASPMGRALAGIKTRETRLEFMGVPARRVLLFAYVLSALMGGVGGALIAMTTRHITPQIAYWTSSGELVFIAILGGAGSALGPFLGSVAFELVRVYAAAAVAEAWQMILGAVLLLVILFAPGGVWGLLSRRWRA